MRVDAYKCDDCGAIFEDSKRYEDHVAVHRKLTLFAGAFPKVEDIACQFANGGWNVQRDKDWLSRYKARVVELVGPVDYEPWSYGWFRTLDDGGSPYYGIATRVQSICPICHREWGQPYYVNHCDHKAKCPPDELLSGLR